MSTKSRFIDSLRFLIRYCKLQSPPLLELLNDPSSGRLIKIINYASWFSLSSRKHVILTRLSRRTGLLIVDSDYRRFDKIASLNESATTKSRETDEMSARGNTIARRGLASEDAYCAFLFRFALHHPSCELQLVKELRRSKRRGYVVVAEVITRNDPGLENAAP
jgi:hypothetical protein